MAYKNIFYDWAKNHPNAILAFGTSHSLIMMNLLLSLERIGLLVLELRQQIQQLMHWMNLTKRKRRMQE